MVLSVEIHGLYWLVCIVIVLGIFVFALIRSKLSRFKKQRLLNDARKNNGTELLLQTLQPLEKYRSAVDPRNLEQLFRQRLTALKSSGVIRDTRMIDFEISNRNYLMLVELHTESQVLSYFRVPRRLTLFYAFRLDVRTGVIDLLGDPVIPARHFHDDFTGPVINCTNWLQQELLGR